MSSQVRDRLESSLSSRSVSTGDGDSSSGSLDFRTFVDVLGTVFADGALTRADTDTVVEYAEQLFDEYVRGFDIPMVPGSVEDWVDDALKSAIPVVIAQLFDRFLPAE